MIRRIDKKVQYSRKPMCNYGERCFKREECSYYHLPQNYEYWKEHPFVKPKIQCRNASWCEYREKCRYQHGSYHYFLWHIQSLMCDFPLDKFPTVIWKEIIGHLDLNSKLAAREVSRTWNNKTTRVLKRYLGDIDCSSGEFCAYKFKCNLNHHLNDFIRWNAENFRLTALPKRSLSLVIDHLELNDKLAMRQSCMFFKKIVDLKLKEFIKIMNNPERIRKMTKESAQRVVDCLIDWFNYATNNGIKANSSSILLLIFTLTKRYDLSYEWLDSFDSSYQQLFKHCKEPVLRQDRTSPRCKSLDLKHLDIDFRIFGYHGLTYILGNIGEEELSEEYHSRGLLYYDISSDDDLSSDHDYGHY